MKHCLYTNFSRIGRSLLIAMSSHKDSLTSSQDSIAYLHHNNIIIMMCDSLHICVYMYMYMCLHVYVHVCTCVCTCVYMCMYIYVHLYVCVCIHVLICVCTCVCACVYIYMYKGCLWASEIMAHSFKSHAVLGWFCSARTQVLEFSQWSITSRLTSQEQVVRSELIAIESHKNSLIPTQYSIAYVYHVMCDSVHMCIHVHVYVLCVY